MGEERGMGAKRVTGWSPSPLWLGYGVKGRESKFSIFNDNN